MAGAQHQNQPRAQVTLSSSGIAIGLSIAIASILCVNSVPLFPTKRESNDAGLIMGFVFCTLSTGFLIYETKCYQLRRIAGTFRSNIFHAWDWFLRCCKRRNYSRYEGAKVDEDRHSNILAYAFFLGFLISQLWNIVCTIILPECFKKLLLADYVMKLLFGLVLMIAMCQKKKPSVNRTISSLGWSFVAAVSFGCAFRYIVEEVIQAYIDIVDKSIEYGDYGLDIPPNITRAEDYVSKLFKKRAHCVHLQHLLATWFVEYILENMPFSAEFFSLCTCFCVMSWKDVGHGEQNGGSSAKDAHGTTTTDYDVIQGQNLISTEPEQSTNRNGPPQIANQLDNPILISTSQTPDALRMSWLNKNKIWILLSICVVIASIVSWLFFGRKMSHQDYVDGVNIFIGQQMTFQLILLTSEGLYFYKMYSLRKDYGNMPHHFQLDVILLIFPLLPLGILLVLRVFPAATSLFDSKITHISIYLNIFWAILNYVQVCFQAIFISQLFCRMDQAFVKRSRYFFLFLAIVNFCVWSTWTAECKLVTIHSQSFHVFGAVPWIIVVYSTVPFVLFCFAHTTTCFLVLFKELSEPTNNISAGSRREINSSSEQEANNILCISPELELEQPFVPGNRDLVLPIN